MRLKPVLTARNSGVLTDSSRVLASSWPSRTRDAASASCLSGRLTSPAIRAAPASDSAATAASQISQVCPAVWLKRARSVRNQ